MALGITPSLTQINTELGLSGKSLQTCINTAGLLYTKQSQFVGYSAAYLTRSPLSISADYIGGTFYVTINSNVSWTATKPSSDTFYAITSGSSGTGNGTITVRVYSNGLKTSRSSTITITGGGITRTIAVWVAANDGALCKLPYLP